MTVREIVRYPDPRLRAVAEQVNRFDDDLQKLATDLLETMRAAPGIGITAPHIGIMKRVVVLELSADEGPKTYVNPELVWASEEKPAIRKAVFRCRASWTRSSVLRVSASVIRI